MMTSKQDWKLSNLTFAAIGQSPSVWLPTERGIAVEVTMKSQGEIEAAICEGITRISSKNTWDGGPKTFMPT